MTGKAAAENAPLVEQKIKEIQERTNAWHIDLVGHSTGGLAGRVYINNLMGQLADGKPTVTNFIMVGTPNKGTPCSIGVDTIYTRFFNKSGEAWREITYKNMEEFNRKITVRKGTKFYGLVGHGYNKTCHLTTSGDGIVPAGSPGVLVCPDHLCFLEDSSLEWKRGIGSYFYSAEDSILQKKTRYLKQNNIDNQVLIKLAGNARWLFSQKYILLENSVLRDRYYNQLLKKGLAYYNGRIKNNKLFKAFQDFYSSSLLKILGCSIESSHRSWIFRIVEKSKNDITHHPIRHFLMMNFLGFTAEEFFNSFVEFKPFVDGPYPCLSRASGHYGELKIRQCKILDNLTKGERRGKPIAIFSCDCEFIYQRIGPDKSEADRYRYDSIREYGTQWENKLREMWNDCSLSRAEIARCLGVSDLTVTNMAHRLNLPMNIPGARVSNDKAHRRSPRLTLSESRKLYRKKWLEVLKENSQANRNKLIKLANHGYLWLMRNDAEWMKNIYQMY